ncbi:CPBP family intramembrane glutamic endopeptidase [Bailinhaonella thermotolerans]|uniref:CPBP family intramembrane metalloprotease n=1 Tax=Bailinhaonella thermotolerans TaxID=1070861 RepID=A0A3A4BG55_9ACTN|nr:CPBP family intramembrane glutamic endopeptidase [Bailinhaonella thermotolerans]RJL33472.1 CPBP family intramembrane metalloprotease [Bailinhaonella thermotolerans]
MHEPEPPRQDPPSPDAPAGEESHPAPPARPDFAPPDGSLPYAGGGSGEPYRADAGTGRPDAPGAPGQGSPAQGAPGQGTPAQPDQATPAWALPGDPAPQAPREPYGGGPHDGDRPHQGAQPYGGPQDAAGQPHAAGQPYGGGQAYPGNAPYPAATPYPGNAYPGNAYPGNAYPGNAPHPGGQPYGGGPYAGNQPHGPYQGGPYQGGPHQQPYQRQPGQPHYPGAGPWQQWGPPPPPQPWIQSAPPGATFDHLARNPLNRWWRPVLGAVMIVVGAFVVVLALFLVAMLFAQVTGIELVTSGDRVFEEPLLDLALQLASIALLIPIVFGVTWLIQRRPVGGLTSVLYRVRWGWLLRCAGVAVIAVVLAELTRVLVYTATGEEVGDLFGWAGWGTFLPALAVVLVLVPFQAAAEEYVFRGWLLQAFGAFLRSPWAGIVVGAVPFMLLHGYEVWGKVDVFAFAVVAGWLTVRTGGLEAAIGLHVVNNIAAFLPSAAAGKLDDALIQGEVPWQAIAGTIVQLGVFSVAVILLARRGRVDVVTPRPVTAEPAAASA